MFRFVYATPHIFRSLLQSLSHSSRFLCVFTISLVYNCTIFFLFSFLSYCSSAPDWLFSKFSTSTIVFVSRLSRVRSRTDRWSIDAFVAARAIRRERNEREKERKNRKKKKKKKKVEGHDLQSRPNFCVFSPTFFFVFVLF